MKMLSNEVQFYSVGTTGTSAAITTPVVDMSGFENVMFVGILSATNASCTLKMQMGTASGSLTSTTGSVAGTVKNLYLDVNRPTQRYVAGVLKGTTTTGAYRTLLAIPYGARSKPTSNDASATGIRSYSPATG